MSAPRPALRRSARPSRPGFGPGLNAGSLRPALLATPEPEGAVRCHACAHRCLIRPDRAGICRVRGNRDGRLLTAVFGRAVSAGADPIEKKPLFHFHPGSTAFSIATRGCNFHCLHCQNWTISQADREGMPVPDFPLPPAAVVSSALAAGSRSIAYTYTEPTVFIEYVLETARSAAKAGLANVLVTNGYETSEALELLAPLVQAANVDLKSFDDAFYRKIVGCRLAPILDSLREMKRRGLWLEVTTLLIPGLNDDGVQLRELAGWLAAELGPETPWHVSRFYPAYRLSDLPPTPAATIARAVEIGRSAGLAHVYSGNVSGGDEDTHCAACGDLLIRRRGYDTWRAGLKAGRCGRCGHSLAGVGLAEWDARGGAP